MLLRIERGNSQPITIFITSSNPKTIKNWSFIAEVGHEFGQGELKYIREP